MTQENREMDKGGAKVKIVATAVPRRKGGRGLGKEGNGIAGEA